MRIDVVGGPLDGLDARAGAMFGWIAERQDGGVVFAKPKPPARRYLYRRAVIDRSEVYIFAGDTHWHCSGCGGFMRKVEGGSESTDCQLCGEAPVSVL